MKRTALIKQLNKLAKDRGATWKLLRHRGDHEVWVMNGQNIVIPRHRELAEGTAHSIIKEAKEAIGE